VTKDKKKPTAAYGEIPATIPATMFPSGPRPPWELWA